MDMKRFVIASLAGAAAVAASLSFGTGTAAAGNCGSANGWGVEALGSASCGFALNIANGIGRSSVGPNPVVITAYSPATGKNYYVTCRRVVQAQAECTGGNAAVIRLWDNATIQQGNELGIG